MADSPRFTTHMSDEDALMWNVEKDPILRSTIVAVAVFDGTPDFDRLRARIDRATCSIPRLRQRVLSPPFRLGPPRWSVEETFDLDFHLRRMRLPAPGTELPGAPVPVFAGGARVDRLYAFAPPAGSAVNVSLISHIDTCCIGVVTDTTAVPDPDILVACLREGFDELLSLS